MENPIKMEDIGVPSLQETSIYKYMYIYIIRLQYLHRRSVHLHCPICQKHNFNWSFLTWLVEGLANCFSRLRDEKKRTWQDDTAQFVHEISDEVILHDVKSMFNSYIYICEKNLCVCIYIYIYYIHCLMY